MRPAATLLATLAMALGAVGLAVAGPGREVAPERLAAATGSVHISNSLEGRAIFGAEALRPGGSTTGDRAHRQRRQRPQRGHADRHARRRDGASRRSPTACSSRSWTSTTPSPCTPARRPGSPPSRSGRSTSASRASCASPRRCRAAPATCCRARRPRSGCCGARRRRRARPRRRRATPRPVKPAAPRKPATPTTPAAPALPAGEALADAIGMPRKGTRVRKRKLRMRLHALGGAKVLALKVSVNGKVRKRVKGSRVDRQGQSEEAQGAEGQDRRDDPGVGRPPLYRAAYVQGCAQAALGARANVNCLLGREAGTPAWVSSHSPGRRAIRATKPTRLRQRGDGVEGGGREGRDEE